MKEIFVSFFQSFKYGIANGMSILKWASVTER